MTEGLIDTFENVFNQDGSPSAFVVSPRDWTASLSLYCGVPLLIDEDWQRGYIGALWTGRAKKLYQNSREAGESPFEAFKTVKAETSLSKAVRYKIRSGDDGKGGDDGMIELRLRPEFAVFVASSLEVIRAELDNGLDEDRSDLTKSTLSALNILCRELAVALDEQASEDILNEITQELIDRYR